jgi:hypothetical protein
VVALARPIALALALALAAPAAAADEPTEAWAQLALADRRLQLGLLVGGSASVAAGAALCGFARYDHALQVAGGVTLAFGAADLAAGIAGYLAARRELRTHRGAIVDARELARVAEHKGVVFAVNLGLDGGFVFAGLTAITASRLTIDHPDRWLAGGIAAVVQGVFAGLIDLMGTLAARRAHRRALHALSSVP